MMTLLVEFLVLLVIAVVVFYAVKYILAEAEADPPIRKIVLLILLVMFLIAVANILTGHKMWGPIIRIDP